jgi:CubicO group peptidase (beta-lactamase class C family)
LTLSSLPTRHPTATPEEVGLDSARLARVSTWMRNYVDAGKLCGALVMVARKDRVVFLDWCGMRDMESESPMGADTIVRIYSMSKPIVNVAAMMLYEQGAFQLDEPVSRYIPALGNLDVFVGGTEDAPRTVPASRDFTVRELMNHTSGLTYGFMNATPVDAIYRNEGIDFNACDDGLEALVTRLGDVPLLAQPGEAWNYSVATDVLGNLVEIWSGVDLQTYLHEQVLRPLGMTDTGFHCPSESVHRFAANYRRNSKGVLAQPDSSTDSRFTRPAKTFSGGGGLVSTAGLHALYTHAGAWRRTGRRATTWTQDH